MRITVKCECGNEIKTSDVYDTFICSACGKETAIEKTPCHGCKDYFQGVAVGFCMNELKTDCQIMGKIREQATLTQGQA